jgi:hypothetical protein
MSRWRKDFIRTHVEQIVSYPEVYRDMSRYDELYSKVNNCILDMVEIASRDDSLVEKLINGLSILSTKLLGVFVMDNNSTKICLGDGGGNDSILGGKVPKDPVSVRCKGRPRISRFKGIAEKARGRKCKKSGSDKLHDCSDVNWNVNSSQVLYFSFHFISVIVCLLYLDYILLYYLHNYAINSGQEI